MRIRNLALGLSLGCVLLVTALAGTASADITLEKPRVSLGVDIMEALQMRKSTKSYSTKEIPIGDLSNILWAANGVNRENGKRTAPSSYGRQYTDLYIVSDQGVYFYDVKEHDE